MKKIVLLIITLVISVYPAISQEEEVPLPKSLQKYDQKRDGFDRKVKFMVGGDAGLQFNSYSWGFSLSPVVGIYPVEWLLVGVGGTYMFTRNRYYQESFHDFGADVFVRGLLWQKRLIIHVGYQYYNLTTYDSNLKKARINAHGLYVGPGYRQAIGDKMSLFMILSFNVARWSKDVNQTDLTALFPFFVPFMGITYDF